MKFYELVVASTREEIGGQARTVTFNVPQSLRSTFSWRPGQHLSIRVALNGEELRRSYSISSSPFAGDPLRITVKRVDGGRVSNYINDEVREGDIVDVAAPFGGFCLNPDKRARRTHYFFGAGSGITPLFSMLCSVMAAEPGSFAHLAYGNKNESSILLNSELNTLLAENPDRMSVDHVLSRPGHWSARNYWRKGIVDKNAVAAFIEKNPPYAQDAQYYICGPGNMNQSVKAALTSLDVPGQRIHAESFGGTAAVDHSVAGTAATAEISLGGILKTVGVDAGQTVLEAARATGMNPPFSCQSGVCGACRAKLTAGTVHMRARMALEDTEIDNGLILTCQSLPATENLAVDYDVR